MNQQLWPFTLGVFGEAMGYVFRRISAAHPKGRQQGLIWYLMQRCVRKLRRDGMALGLTNVRDDFERAKRILFTVGEGGTRIELIEVLTPAHVTSHSLFIILAPALMAASHYSLCLLLFIPCPSRRLNQVSSDQWLLDD